MDALDDADFGLKVREQTPISLDDALRVSLQLEAWMKDVTRTRRTSLGIIWAYINRARDVR